MTLGEALRASLRHERLRRLLIGGMGIAVAVVAGLLAFFRLEWVNHHPHLTARVPLDELLAQLRLAHPLPVAGIAFCIALGVPLRGLQIRITAHTPRGPVRYRPALRGVAASMFLQNILPAKIGDAARLIILKNDGDVPVPVAIAASLVDRSLDAVALLFTCLAVVLLPVSQAPGLHGVVSKVAAILAGLLVLAMTLLAAHRPLGAFLEGRFDRLAAMVRRFGAGVRYAAHRGRLAVGLVTSIVTLLVYAGAVKCGLEAVDIALPAGAPLFLVIVLLLVIGMPSSPSGAGTFHAAALFSLHSLGVPDQKALAFAVIAHACDALVTSATCLAVMLVVRGSPIRWRELLSEPGAEAAPIDDGVSPARDIAAGSRR